MAWDKFKRITSILLSRYSDLNMQLYEDRIEYSVDNVNYSYTSSDFDALHRGLSLYTADDTCIYCGNKVEVLLESCNPRYGLRFMDQPLVITDADMSYKIASPSDELLVAFLFAIPDEHIRNFRRVLPSHMRSSRYFKNEDGTVRLLDILLKVTRISFSMTVSCTTSLQKESLLKHINSMLFSLAYNSDITFKPVFSLSEIELGLRRPLPRRLAHPSEIEVPKLFYIAELTEQYNLALASDDAFVQFIAYYHIMEYFYDDVYSDDLVKSIKDILLHPGFSAKKPKEIAKIIDTVQRKTRANKDAFQGNELEALELVIKRFVSVEQLRDDLNTYDSNLVDYYKTHEIHFSSGDTIDFSLLTNDKLSKKIAARIYKTRNALVHHKSNNTRVKDRGLYHPFKDEQELAKEIPLMRLIAESIIIKSSAEI